MAFREWLRALMRLPSSRQMAEVNSRLRREAEAHEATLRELEASRRELETRVVERTKELSLVKARFETALHGAEVYVFSQDQNLKYTWMYSPRGEEAAAEMIGRTDGDLPSSPEHDTLVAAKRQVLATGKPVDTEASYILPERRALFALRIDPTFGPDGKIDGIMCAAIDIGRTRSLESEQRRLTEELDTALQRYETALRGSNVTVFTQDRDLRYTSISSAMFGRSIDEIVGQLDDDILPPDSRAPIVKLKREVLDAGAPKDGEFRIPDQEMVRWYDVHIEPLRDVTGSIVGLTCAAVDVTARKAGEAHLRELMRELTHRSKNLLAVIQAMARQTARHVGSTEAFLEQFSARLQALAASHDLLVQESWHGASLSELARSQLGHYLDRDGSQVSVQGPSLLLRPEAAQSLGLALHELATNAVKYGALSVPSGHVTIGWRILQPSEGGGIEVLWSETGGPKVDAPNRRGFGTLVIERNLSRSLEAEVQLSFQPEGVLCRMIIPAANLASGR
jgi:PAS domain S-box-containing protein